MGIALPLHGRSLQPRPSFTTGMIAPPQEGRPMPMTMKAPVLHAVREPQVVEEVELDDPKQNEVLVKMVASGVCHSCLHAADGSWGQTKVPMVLGDEGAGVVE